MFLLLSLAGIAANAGLSYHYMKLGSPDNAGSLWDSLVSGTGMIFGMGDGLQGMYGKTKYEMAIFWFSWGCILAAVTYAAKPWFQSRRSGKSDIQHARTLLSLYSQNPCSYLALEEDVYKRQPSGWLRFVPLAWNLRTDLASRQLFLQMEDGLLSEQDQELPFTGHVVCVFQHIDFIEHLIMIVLVRTQEVVVGDPECHVIVCAVVIIVAAADPVSGFKSTVEPFDHLLVGTELLGDCLLYTSL